MSIRKDAYVKATTNTGTVYGKVLSVKGANLHLTTASGPAVVAKSDAVRIKAAEYTSAEAVAATAAAFADPVPGPAVRVRIVEAAEPAVKPTRTKSAASGAARPGKKGTGKKAVALSVFAELTVDGAIPSRKAFSATMAERTGLSAKGASTYFYNIKSGRWA